MKNCLVVDDSRVIRTVACSILRQLNFDAREAEDGEQALECCRTGMPDVILLDLQMPGMSGIEFLRNLRRFVNGKQPYVILCTTENDVPRLTEALNAGASQYLMKPFDHESLAQKLAEAGMA